MILTENQILDSLKGDAARIEMDKLFNSVEYNNLIRQISVNNAKFQELPDSLKLVSIYMNRKGLDLYLKDTWTLLFNRKPPTIEEYLDPKVSGPFVEKMYDGWKNVILRDFGNVFTRQTPLELVFSGAIGLGKCHGYGEKILKYDGSYIEAQNIKVGDQLRGIDSTPRTVLKTGVGYGKLYKITTTKNESFIVNADHQLMLKRLVKTQETGKTHATRKTYYSFDVVQMSVADLLKKSPNQIKNQYKLFKSPVVYSPRPHIVDPYLIGLLLGDGSLSNNITVYSIDPEIETYLKSEASKYNLNIIKRQSTGCFKYTITSNISKLGSNPIRTEIIRLGMMNKNWNNKFVPEEYKFDSEENRLKLLAGLLDTDGYYNPTGVFEFSNKSEQLAYDVYEIALDLGFAAIIRYKPTNSQYIQNSPGWRVSISGDLDKIPTLIERKKAKPRSINKNILHHGIKSIEELPSNNYYGFEVDQDHLYLDANRFVHHNTSIARWLLIWVLLRICLMKNPQAVLNVTQETLLCLALFTITLDKAALALIKPFIALLEQSPFFQVVEKQAEFKDFDVGSGITPYVVRQKYIEFPNNIIINLGSNVSHALSYSVFAGMLDEAEWGSNSPEDAFALYTNLRERIRSRFLGSNYTLMCLISSARYSQGIIADYVNNTAADDPHTKIYSFAIWDIKHFDSYKNKGHFYVLVGNKTNPHRILDAEEQISYENNQFVIPARCQVIKVPEVYRKDFQSRIEEALNNLAGIAVTSDSSYIFTADPIECKELSGEISIESNLGDGVNLFDLIPDTIVETVLGNTRFKINSFAPRYAHLDLAETGKAGITVVHPELNSAGLTVYVVDLLIEIYTNTKIDITAVKQLISSISGICNLRKFTSDQYQSTQLRQQLEIEDSIEDVALLSVVKTIEPYETLATLIQGGRIYTGFCPKLKKQLRGIQITNDGKVKQATYVDGSHGDLADSTTGAIWNAVMDMSSDIDISTSLVSNWYNKPKSNIKEEVLLLGSFNSL